MGRWCLLGGDVGPRTPAPAATLRAPVVARARQLPLLLPDGWKAYPVAWLHVVGVVERPRRRGKVGHQPRPRLVAPQALCSAQGGQVRHTTGHGVEVSRRDVSGWPTPCGPAGAPPATRRAAPDGLPGTRGWPLAGAGSALARPPPVSLLAPCSSPGEGRGPGQPGPLCNVTHASAPRAPAAHPREGPRADRPCRERSGVPLVSGAYRSSAYPAEGRTAGTAAAPSSPGPSWK